MQHAQVDPEQDRHLVEGDGNVAQLEGALASALVRSQLQANAAPLQHRPLDLLHAVDLALLVAGLLDVPLVDDPVRPILEATNRVLEPLDLLLLRHVRLLLAHELDLAGQGVGGVVARPGAQPTAVHARDLGHRLVEQVSVVADDDDGAVEVPDEILEPLAPGEVEVRLGLVEQQQRRILDERRREADELALAAAEDAGRQLQLPLLQAQLEQQAAGATLERRAAGAVVSVQQLRLPVQRAFQRGCVAVDRWVVQLDIDSAQLRVDRPQVSPRAVERLASTPIVAQRVLRQERDRETASPGRLSGVLLLVAGDDPQQRGLARSVAANDPDPRSVLDVQVQPVEDHARSVCLAYPAQGEEAHWRGPLDGIGEA